MGLPRSLRDGLSEYLRKQERSELFMIGFAAGVNAAEGTVQRAIIDAGLRGISSEKQYQSVARWWCRIVERPAISSPDDLSRVKARLYVGIESTHCDEIAAFRDVMVPRYFLSKLVRLNAERETRDREAIDLRLRISIVRNRVYASRTFPASLRAIIFERDNYTCQVCLRGREVLKDGGIHLECDHVLAWEDGGLTTYDNGQTICSVCNKAKHHAKRYLGLVAHLNSSPR